MQTKQCPICNQESMIIFVDGWICLCCLFTEKFKEKGGEN